MKLEDLLKDTGNDKKRFAFYRGCIYKKDVNEVKELARVLDISIGKKSVNALCFQIGRRLAALEVFRLETERSLKEEKARVKKHLLGVRAKDADRTNIQHVRVSPKKLGTNPRSQPVSIPRRREGRRENTEASAAVIPFKPCMEKSKNVTGQLMELTYMRRPNLHTMPIWAVFRLRGYCCNVFDLQWLMQKNKLSPLTEIEMAALRQHLHMIEAHIAKGEMKRFLERQASVHPKAYQTAHFLSLLGIHKLPVLDETKIRKVIKKEAGRSPKGFTFHRNFIKSYMVMETVSVATQNPVVNTYNELFKLIPASKKFIRDLCHSISNVPEERFFLKESLTGEHRFDTGGFQPVTLGLTKTTCDNLSAFDTNHICCSKIEIRSGMTVSETSRTIVHELLHAELHERRAHPLNPKTSRSMSMDNKFEEGICVLAEFLWTGLHQKAHGENFRRTPVTDQYFQRLSAASMVDDFGNETTVQKDARKQAFEVKYNSGFAVALSSMVTNALTFEELLHFYVKHGIFPIRKRGMSRQTAGNGTRKTK